VPLGLRWVSMLSILGPFLSWVAVCYGGRAVPPHAWGVAPGYWPRDLSGPPEGGTWAHHALIAGNKAATVIGI
jgi:hypothetical protein